MTVRRFLEQEGDGLTFEHYYRHPRSYSRRGIFSVDEPAPTMRGTNRPMPPNYRRHEGDTTDPSAGEVRALSAAMRARIQTFPTAYRWIGPRTHVEQMIGNAVPVRLRSEEHTSELQSLMRNSYAVFCLKKKTHTD